MKNAESAGDAAGKRVDAAVTKTLQGGRKTATSEGLVT
jgi:hypothetical protein